MSSAKTVIRGTSKKNIRQAAEILRSGGIIVFPTETVYGLGADATNDEAVKKVFKIKGRPADNPLIAHVATLRQAKSLTKDFPETALKLANRFWPGPLTLVLEKNGIVSNFATCGLQTLAIRVPDNKTALELIGSAKIPVVAPSANLSGKPSPTSVSHVVEDMGGTVDMILDGGDTSYGIESTIVDLTSGAPKILRLGSISKRDIEKVIGTIGVSGTEHGAPKAPGMKYTHYSPDAEVVLIKEPDALEKIQHLYLAYTQNKEVAVMTFSEFEASFANLKTITVSSIKDPAKYMHDLYRTFRQLDKEVGVILVHEVPETEEWAAIADKLAKAADRTV